jgi:hypothetical protein
MTAARYTRGFLSTLDGGSETFALTTSTISPSASSQWERTRHMSKTMSYWARRSASPLPESSHSFMSRIDSKLPHHPTKLYQGRTLAGHSAHAGVDDGLQGRRDGPINLICDGGVGVDDALDAIPDIVHVGMKRPTCVQAAGEGYLWSGPLTPVAFQIADDQATTLIGEEGVVDAKVPVGNAEGVEADQGVDEMEKPRLVDGEVGTAGQDGPGPCQLLKDQ